MLKKSKKNKLRLYCNNDKKLGLKFPDSQSSKKTLLLKEPGDTEQKGIESESGPTNQWVCLKKVTETLSSAITRTQYRMCQLLEKLIRIRRTLIFGQYLQSKRLQIRNKKLMLL